MLANTDKHIVLWHIFNFVYLNTGTALQWYVIAGTTLKKEAATLLSYNMILYDRRVAAS